MLLVRTANGLSGTPAAYDGGPEQQYRRAGDSGRGHKGSGVRAGPGTAARAGDGERGGLECGRQGNDDWRVTWFLCLHGGSWLGRLRSGRGRRGGCLPVRRLRERFTYEASNALRCTL